MSVLLRAAELMKLPVVTLGGEDIAQIKDVIYASGSGELAGFTLNGRGIFAGPLRKTLPWENVHGLGPEAVMIKDETSLGDKKALRGTTEGAGGAVLGSTVITQGGRNLGTVTDVILAVGERVTDAVGYEIEPTDDSAPRRQFVPLPDTLSVSGEALMLPESAIHFIRDDLAGFGAAVEEFRRQLRSEGGDRASGRSSAGTTSSGSSGPAQTTSPVSGPVPSTPATPSMAQTPPGTEGPAVTDGKRVTQVPPHTQAPPTQTLPGPAGPDGSTDTAVMQSGPQGAAGSGLPLPAASPADPDNPPDNPPGTIASGHGRHK